MKLIDILKRELRGNWPEGAAFAVQDLRDRGVKFAGEKAKKPYFDGNLEVWKISSGWCFDCDFDFVPHEVAEDYSYAIVTKEEFLGWDGKGTPPVGTLCKYTTSTGVGGVGRMLYCGEEYFLVKDAASGKEKSLRREGCVFSRVDDKVATFRDLTVHEMASASSPRSFSVLDTCRKIYDAVAAGKIRGLAIKDMEE